MDIICGYDAYNPFKRPRKRSETYKNASAGRRILKCYLDVSKPFGHELVLYTMLMFSHKDYPWRNNKPKLLEGVKIYKK